MSADGLTGITWNHSRAFPPLLASAQRFEEMHLGIEISWRKRTLHEFGHADISSLAERFDLLVIDHPALGKVYETGALLDLKQLLPEQFLLDLANNSVGPSYASYLYQDSLFAIPIDAATPVASYRPDLLAAHRADVPRHWAEVLRLARQELVVMPGFHADLFLNFLALCVSLDNSASPADSLSFDRSAALESLDMLRHLASNMPREIFEWNPIAVYELLSTEDRFAYCPFAYSYSNYSRPGFSKHLLKFADVAQLETEKLLRTVLGGTGIAISSKCKNVSAALAYISYVAGQPCQGAIYALSGGQPAHRLAWLDETVNRVSSNFFKDTLDAMQRAYVRPRYSGYIEFQGVAGVPIQQYLNGSATAAATVDDINRLYQESRAHLEARSA